MFRFNMYVYVNVNRNKSESLEAVYRKVRTNTVPYNNIHKQYECKPKIRLQRVDKYKCIANVKVMVYKFQF